MTSLSQQPPDVRPLEGRTSQDWAHELRNAIRNPHVLCDELRISRDLADSAASVNSNFQILVPRPFLARMEPGNQDDPLLLQVLPQANENIAREGFTGDPVGDLAATRLPGLLHKYNGRALLIASPTCAVHCRYCFRKEFPYQETPKGSEAWQPAIEEISADDSISEIILSGGDPLMLVDATLSKIIHSLEAIPHIMRLRIHTRLPIVIPQRVTDRLVNLLKATRLITVMVIHSNHTNELDSMVARQLDIIQATGTLLLNQSVLLRGVNDSLAAQISLSKRLIEIGVLPYYLHQLDRVTGTAHFDTKRQVGLNLIAEMRKQLPGYMVPRYVIEEAGKPHKTLLA